MTELPEKRRFNSHQIRITGFTQSGPGTGDGVNEYTFTLSLPEAKGPGFAIRSVQIEAVGHSVETLTQYEILNLFLDATIHAIAREKAGVRPGEPSPPDVLNSLKLPSE